jgi:hypothetical protein
VGKRWNLAPSRDDVRLFVFSELSDDMMVIERPARRPLKTRGVGRTRWCR